jgi:excisionase family DNA binding protein
MVATGMGELKSASKQEQQALSELAHALDRANGVRLLAVDDPGRTFEVPEVAARLFRDMVHHLARGRAVALHSLGEMLTTQEAADVLNVSRPYVVKLLERGEIPFETVGPRRRIRREDLLTFKRGRDQEHRRGLQRLVEISEELGLYDLPIGPEVLEEANPDEGTIRIAPMSPPLIQPPGEPHVGTPGRQRTRAACPARHAPQRRGSGDLLGTSEARDVGSGIQIQGG